MPDKQQFDLLIIGSGEAGKNLAWAMAKAGRRTAVIDDLDDQRAGIDDHIDQQEQACEQQHRAEFVRCDVRVKTVGGHDRSAGRLVRVRT